MGCISLDIFFSLGDTITQLLSSLPSYIRHPVVTEAKCLSSTNAVKSSLNTLVFLMPLKGYIHKYNVGGKHRFPDTGA